MEAEETTPTGKRKRDAGVPPEAPPMQPAKAKLSAVLMRGRREAAMASDGPL